VRERRVVMRLLSLVAALAVCFALASIGCSSEEPETAQKETPTKEGTSETSAKESTPKEAPAEESTEKETPADETAPKETPAGDSTPKATAEAFVAAMEKQDAEAIWGLMSSKAISQTEEGLAKLKKDEDGMTGMALGMLGISKDELATMDSKQLFMRTMKLMFAMMAEAEKEGMGDQTDFEIGEEKIDGDRATIAVTNKAKTKDKTKEMQLVKEGGVWKFATNPVGKK
jgi:hypothetical protein